MGGGGGVHPVSHPGYFILDCLVDIHAVWHFFGRAVSVGGGTSLQNSCIDELSST